MIKRLQISVFFMVMKIKMVGILKLLRYFDIKMIFFFWSTLIHKFHPIHPSTDSLKMKKGKIKLFPTDIKI